MGKGERLRGGFGGIRSVHSPFPWATLVLVLTRSSSADSDLSSGPSLPSVSEPATKHAPELDQDTRLIDCPPRCTLHIRQRSLSAIQPAIPSAPGFRRQQAVNDNHRSMRSFRCPKWYRARLPRSDALPSPSDTRSVVAIAIAWLSFSSSARRRKREARI